MKQRGSNSVRKIPNGLVAAGSAAVLAVYAAGYTKTRSAADQFEGEAAVRRAPALPAGNAPARTEVPASAPVAEAAATPAVVAPPDAPKETVKQPKQPELVASVQPKPVAFPQSEASTAPTAQPQAAPQAVQTPAPVPSAPVTTAVNITPPAAPAPAAPQVSPVAPPWKDGTWEGWGNCRHGDIQASVVITGGKIVSATIAQCLTRYSCDIIDMLPPQVPKRQSPDVDNVGGATQSANAFYYAVYDALRKSKLALSQ